MNFTPSLPAQSLARLLQVAAALLTLGSVQATASILMPNAVEVNNVEALTTSLQSAASSQSRSNVKTENGRERTAEDQWDLIQAVMPRDGSTSSSTSAPSGGMGTGGPSAAVTASAPLPADCVVIHWMRGRCQIAPPSPPGTDLLRPPQG